MNCVDEETGEIFDIEKFKQLNLDRDEKIENMACWIKNLKSDAEQLKKESDNLMKRKKVVESKAESLKKYLKDFLAGEKYKSSKVSVLYRKSESVNVTDITKIPEKYLKFSDPEPDKVGIKAAIKSGEKISGASIETSQNMIIK
jgi:hypothetical protein